MKRIVTPFVFILMLAIGASSCEKHEDSSGSIPTPGEPVEANFHSKICGSTETRAYDDRWTPGDAVGIFMVESGRILSPGTISEGTDNVRYVVTNSNGAMLPAGIPVYFPSLTESVDFISYYPYKTPLTGYLYPVDVSNQSDPEAIDLLYSNNVTGASASTPSVTLNFGHKLCRIVMNVTAGVGVKQADLAGIMVTIHGINTTANFNLATGALSYTGSAGIISSTANQGYVASAIILPTLTIPVAGRSIEFSSANVAPRTWSIPPDMQFREGNSYIYTVTITTTGVTMHLTGVDSWTVDTPGSGTAVPN